MVPISIRCMEFFERSLKKLSVNCTLLTVKHTASPPPDLDRSVLLFSIAAEDLHGW